MTLTHRKTDAELKASVIDELEWVPDVDATEIGVGVTDGAITLSGEVRTYPEKRNAERAALRVKGVTAVANEIVVGSNVDILNDADIARDVGETLDRAAELPPGAVKAVVRDRAVTLSGTVLWQFQRHAAERIVGGLRGVNAVHNAIRIEARPAVRDLKKAITAALLRNAQIDSDHIAVISAAGGVVTLTGTVRSAAERRQAEHAAWAAPGVTSVRNLITVEN